MIERVATRPATGYGKRHRPALASVVVCGVMLTGAAQGRSLAEVAGQVRPAPVRTPAALSATMTLGQQSVSPPIDPKTGRWRGQQGSRSVLQTLAEDSDLVVQGVIVSFNTRDVRLGQLGGVAGVEVDVVLRVDEVYKGSPSSGSEIRFKCVQRNARIRFTSGQRLVTFLIKAMDAAGPAKSDAAVQANLPQYLVLEANYGTDTLSTGLLGIDLGNTTYVSGDAGQLSRYMGTPVETVIREVKSYLRESR